MISEANRHFTLTYDNGLVTVSCALCAAFELVVERSEAGEKKARERVAASALGTRVPQLLNPSRR